MRAIRKILNEGHEDVGPDVLLYMKSMAERHGFKVLEEEPFGLPNSARIEIDYPLLRDRVYVALFEDIPAGQDASEGHRNGNGRSAGH